MPRITLIDPFGTGYQIDSGHRNTLRAWFEEILPMVNADLDRPDTPPAQIGVWPLFKSHRNRAAEADWLADTRVLGRRHPFPARNGAEGLAQLDQLRQQLDAELAALR